MRRYGSGVTFTVADESADTTCFPLFVTAATGVLSPKTGSNLAFNSSTGELTATLLAGALNGTVGTTTPAAGAFTTLAASDDVTVGGGAGERTVSITSTDLDAILKVVGGETDGQAQLKLWADDGDDAADRWSIIARTNATLDITLDSVGPDIVQLTASTAKFSTSLIAPSTAINNADEGGTAKLTTQSVQEVVTLTGATTDTTIAIPSGSLLLGASFCVNTAVSDTGGNDTWSADYVTGSATALTAGAAAAQNTKVDTLVVPEVAGAATEIRFTPNGGNFDAGVIEVVAYYVDLTSLANA